MANEDLFRRSYERMNLAELSHYSDSLKGNIAHERADLVQYGSATWNAWPTPQDGSPMPDRPPKRRR